MTGVVEGGRRPVVQSQQTSDARLQPWRDAWPGALAAWSAHTLLRDPLVMTTSRSVKAAGMKGQIAAIRLRDASILVNMAMIEAYQLHGCEHAILAHEIGHHIYVPGNLADHVRLFAVMRGVLQGLPEQVVGPVANLWADSLINDRLVRDGAADITSVYSAMFEHAPKRKPDRVWCVYARSLEVLWRQPRGSFVDASHVTQEQHGDAVLLSRIVRTFANDWVRGGRRYAAVMYRWLNEDIADSDAQGSTFVQRGLHDTEAAAADQHGEQDELPAGVLYVDPAESEPLGGDLGSVAAAGDVGDENGAAATGHGQNVRTPHELGQLLRAMGMNVDQHALVTRYYKELALPHLVPFPSTEAPQSTDPQPEGLEPWLPGDSIEGLDVLQSVLQSPMLVPGVTTVRRVYGTAPGTDPAHEALDLDIYVDCSGSMPDPRRQISYLTLAATILSLSCLRAGGRVQATLWSGAGVFDTTDGFSRDERVVLGMVTGFVSGATAFPLHLLRDTYAKRRPHEGPAHVVVISDDGIDTMLETDERGRPGPEVVAEAMSKAAGGGTLVLNLYREAAKYKWSKTLKELGFHIHAVRDWKDLVAFSRAFVRQTWGAEPGLGAPGTKRG